MHNAVLSAAKPLNGVYNGHTLLEEGTHDMDMDKVLDILMRLREEGAARDVKLEILIAGQRELNDFKNARVLAVDKALEMLERRDSDFGRRLDALEKANLSALTERVTALEKSGIRGWLEGSAAKRLGTLTALIVGIMAALAVILQSLAWLKAHLHF